MTDDSKVESIKHAPDGVKSYYAQKRAQQRLKRENNPQLGAEMLISAWGVDDEDCVKFLKVIAQKPGALRNIDRTIKAALISGLSGGEDLTLPLLRDAWKNRDLGDIA